jgi:hypothetical protein
VCKYFVLKILILLLTNILFIFSCTRGFEGKNCELQSIGSWFSENEQKNLPPELKQLYDKINKNNKNNKKQN